tara:strand:- start:3484 stop:3945 length:462 start_codon:yes stop_codon:yes gene_type:complete
MIKVKVICDEKSWSKKLKKKENFFNKVCRNFPQKFQFSNKKIFLTLLLSNNEKIKFLNKKFRNKNKPTDILSFPFDQKIKNSKKIYLGDIIISFNFLNKPKNLSIYEFKKKTIKIFIHGYLHLLGYDHMKHIDYKKMVKEEEKVFKFVKKILN